MKTFLTIVITAAATWFVVGHIYELRRMQDTFWVFNLVKYPGGRALSEIKADMDAGRHDLAKAKIDAFCHLWKQFDLEPPLTGPGILNFAVEFSKVEESRQPTQPK